MLQHLTNNWRDGLVIIGRTGSHDLILQVSLEATLRSSHAGPPRDLTIVVRRAAAVEEAAVPLHPAIRVLFLDPAGRLPLNKSLAALALVAIVEDGAGSDELFLLDAGPPFFRELLVLIFEFLADDARHDRPVVAALIHERAEAEHLRWREVRLEVGIVRPIWKYDALRLD